MEPAARAVVIGVDTGGTFTDVFASDGRVAKVPSTPQNPAEAILRGLRAVGLRPGDAVGHGTTVATNAVLERKGARTALLTTEGFEDVLAIRRQNRPSLYDLTARWPDPLVPQERRVGIRERLDYQGIPITPLDRDTAAAAISGLLGEGIEAIAVCLLFSYTNGGHETTVGELARAILGAGLPVCLSSVTAPQYGEYERTSTTVVNAYVMPVMQRYLESLQHELREAGVRSLHVMHSNGGLVGPRAAQALPVSTILSGPAAGVVGAREVARSAGHGQIISFDMGGTSTDVALVPGQILESGEGEVATFPLLVPMLTIETVGAGGGSIARVDAAGGLHVGPLSAGADPGPAAYGRGTLPTVTDANLVLGRLSPDGLLGGDMPLRIDRARAAIGPIADALSLTIEEAAWAILRLATSNMERAVRAVSSVRGHDPRRFTLFPFGGAGPLHAAELAEGLGIRTALVPPHPGVMAALGLTVPDLQRDYRRTVLLPLDADAIPQAEARFAELEASARLDFEEEYLFGPPRLERAVDVRYLGQSYELRVMYEADALTLAERFTRAYEERYGYANRDAPMQLVNVRLRAVLPRLDPPDLLPPWPEAPRAERSRAVHFSAGLGIADLRAVESRVVWRAGLDRGTVIPGPAVIEQFDSVTIVPPGWRSTVDSRFNLLLEQQEP